MQPFYEQVLSDLDAKRSMQRPVYVAHSSFIEGSHMTNNTDSEVIDIVSEMRYALLRYVNCQKCEH